MVYLKKVLIGFLYAVGFTGGVFLMVSGYESLTSVSDGQQLSSSLINSIIRKTNGIDYNTGVLELKGRIQLSDEVTDATCDSSTKGSMVYSGDTLNLCNGTDWIDLEGGNSGITLNVIEIYNEGRRWSDGSYAESCYYYKHPNGINLYSGETGDGIYWVKPDDTVFKVYCDMTEDGGGWALVGVNANGSAQLNQTTAYNTPELNTTSAVDWKYDDTTINMLKSGMESNGYRITYNKKSSLGTFYPKRYFWSSTCNFNASQKADINGSACINWSVDENLVSSYIGDGDGGWYGLQRRKASRNNVGWRLYEGYTYFACYESTSYDGASQTGYCDGVTGDYDVAHYMWVR